MVATAEVTVISGKIAHHIPINGDIRSIQQVLDAAGVKGDATVRVNTKLATDYGMALQGGETITVFMTKTVSEAGVKGAAKSV